MKNILNFIRYNNAFPLLMIVVFLGAGGAFAASADTQTEVRAVDNSYIRTVDVDALPLRIAVVSVVEDQLEYNVGYSIETAAIVDAVWQPVTAERALNVSKAALGERDLGTYVEKELSQVRDYERSKLAETKGLEIARGESSKVVATIYSGLIGAVLSESTETFEAYQPVKQEPVDVVQLPVDVSELRPLISSTPPVTEPVVEPPTPAPPVVEPVAEPVPVVVSDTPEPTGSATTTP